MVSKKDIAAVVVSTVLSLVVFELFLEHVARIKPIPSGWGWAGSPRRILSKSTGDSEANQFGYRGQPIHYDKDDYVVVLLGDSQVESASEPVEKMPERLLEAELGARMGRKVKAFSLAASGWGQDQQLQALERYLQSYRADLVLVWSTPGNDFWEDTFVDRSPLVMAGPIKPTYRIEADRLTGPFYPKDFYYGGFALTQLLGELYGKTQHKSLPQVISDAWKTRLPIRPRSPTPACEQYQKLDQQTLLTSEDKFDLTKKYRLETAEDLLESKTHYAPYMLPQNEMDDYQRRLMALLYARIREVANGHGAAMKVFYITKKLPSFQIACIGSEQSGYFAVDRNFDVALSKVVPSDLLINIPVPGGKEINVSDADRHLSTIGNERTMRALAEELTRAR
jgi:hypothetical protein